MYPSFDFIRINAFLIVFLCVYGHVHAQLIPANNSYSGDEQVWEGKRLSKKGQHDEAIKALQKAIDVNPKNGLAHAELSRVYVSQNNLDKALEHINKSIELNPIPSSYLYRADIFIQKQKYSEAIDDYSIFLAGKPQDRDVYKKRARAYGKRSDFNKAITDYTFYIEKNSSDHEAYFERGQIYVINGEPEKALDDFHKAINLNPGNEEYYLARAKCFKSKGQITPAISDLTRAIMANPKNAEAYSLRASLLAETKHYSDAMNDIEKAREIGGQVDQDVEYEVIKGLNETNRYTSPPSFVRPLGRTY